ncbi:hypothetical protein HanIR_Chr12g0612671 [Helianthus annuus]|nr:hypothetical protein HanIR_Chr12g0612671 [Helianthus annuus]
MSSLISFANHLFLYLKKVAGNHVTSLQREEDMGLFEGIVTVASGSDRLRRRFRLFLSVKPLLLPVTKMLVVLSLYKTVSGDHMLCLEREGEVCAYHGFMGFFLKVCKTCGCGCGVFPIFWGFRTDYVGNVHYCRRFLSRLC